MTTHPFATENEEMYSNDIEEKIYTPDDIVMYLMAISIGRWINCYCYELLFRNLSFLFLVGHFKSLKFKDGKDWKNVKSVMVGKPFEYKKITALK